MKEIKLHIQKQDGYTKGVITAGVVFGAFSFFIEMKPLIFIVAIVTYLAGKQLSNKYLVGD